MKVIKKKACFQAIDSLIDKINLLEATLKLQTNSNVSQNSEELLNKMEMIELHIHHVENRILFHSGMGYEDWAKNTQSS